MNINDSDELINNGVALSAYERMQFSDTEKIEREELAKAFLRAKDISNG